MIKVVIFDCFGVLAEDGWLPFKRKYIGDNEQLAQEIADLGKQNEYGLLSNDELAETVAARLKIDRSIYDAAVGHSVPNDELFAYIATTLKPRYKIGVLSNANFDVVGQLFAAEQAALIDASVLSYEAKLIKPDERAYDLIAKRLGVTPDECVFVDDIERYCVAAEASGMQAILYRDTQQIIAQLANILSL